MEPGNYKYLKMSISNFSLNQLNCFCRTPLHADVFTSYSWSANIVGKKRWLLFPPGEETNLKNNNGDLIYDESLDIIDKDNNVLKKFIRGIEIIQGAGEVVFIPSGWHHQVWNLVMNKKELVKP